MLNRMNPVNPIFALLSLFTAMLPVILFIRFFGVPTTQGRFATIDGLRGYLAFYGIFIYEQASGKYPHQICIQILVKVAYRYFL
jgi:hypothetical protein